MISEEYIDGAYWSEELSVRELHPALQVLPHAHGVFHCLNGKTLDLEVAHEFLDGFMRLYLEKIVREDRTLDDIAPLLLLPPSVLLRPLAAERDLYFAVGYVTKTIKLVSVYEAALDALEPREWWQVNSQMNLFFEGFASEMLEEARSGRPWNRRQLFRSGTLRSQSGEFVGTPRARRTTHADRKRLRESLIEVMKQPRQWHPDDSDVFGLEESVLNELAAANDLDDRESEDDNE